MEHNEFENTLRNKVADFTMTPPVNGWKNLDASIAKMQRQRLMRRRALAMAVAAVVLIAVTVGSHLLFTNNDVAPLADIGNTLSKQIEITKPTPITQIALRTATPETTTKTIGKKIPTVIPSTEIAAVVDTVTNTTFKEIVTEQKTEKTISVEKEESGVAKNTETHKRPTYPTTRFDKKRRSANWSVGLYASNMPSGERSNNGTPVTGGRVANTAEFSKINAQSTNYLSLDGQKLNHKFPLSFGVGVRKNITDRLGLETGVVYTYLESSMSNTEFKSHYEQQLHYIGIPLSATYTIGTAGGFEFYTMAGGMVEKCVSGRYENSVKADILSEKREDHGDIVAKSLQFSANINVGAAYKLNKRFGLFVEPGLNYYFENDDQPHSYRTDNRLNFNLKLGLKTFF